MVISVQVFYVAVLDFKNNGAFHFALTKAVELCFLCMPYYKISNKDLNHQELLLEILASTTVVPKERKVMLNHIPASQQCQFLKAEGPAGELLETETFCFAFLSPMSNQELPGSWLSPADYNQDNAEVNTEVKGFA